MHENLTSGIPRRIEREPPHAAPRRRRGEGHGGVGVRTRGAGGHLRAAPGRGASRRLRPDDTGDRTDQERPDAGRRM